MKKWYALVRALHLYIGLLISTLVIVFGISVLVFNHAPFFNQTGQTNSETKVFKLDSIPVRGTDLLTARAILSKINIIGEIDYINKTDSGMIFPVNTTRKIHRIKVNNLTGKITVTTSPRNIFQATTYLHAMPGPHNANIRGNSGFIQLWRYLIEAIVYSVLFLTISGIFIWSFYQSERKMGSIFAVAGIVVFLILITLTF